MGVVLFCGDCGAEFDSSVDKYCPGCGADMRPQLAKVPQVAPETIATVTNDIWNSGELAFVSHDIVIENQYAFRKGEQVLVESISPNSQRPEYKYVMFSNSLKQRYQLSDTDLQPHPQVAGYYAGSKPNIEQSRKSGGYLRYTVTFGAIELLGSLFFLVGAIWAINVSNDGVEAMGVFLLVLIFLSFLFLGICSVLAFSGPGRIMPIHYMAGAWVIVLGVITAVSSRSSFSRETVIAIWVIAICLLMTGVSILIFALLAASYFRRQQQTYFGPSVSQVGMRTCPYCAEVVKAAAIKCRYCGSQLA